MLTELHIEHLGVIERLDLTLGPGLTAVTGETGAGKTMLVEALELLVGGRADATIVRPGAREARVDGRFVVGDDEVVLSRVVPAEGRSRAYIDGRPSTVGALAEAAAGLVDLHGQHEHQSLLAGPVQRAALDAFGSVDITPLRDARAQLTVLDAELAALGGAARERAREIDLLRFQVAELDAAGLDDPNEDDALAGREDVLADAAGHREAGAVAHAALTDDGGARDALAGALSTVAGRAPFREATDRLAALLAELDDVAGGLRDTAEGIDEDPEQLAAVRVRRQLLRDLCRKYGEDIGEVLAYHSEAADRLAELEAHDRRASVIDGERAAAAATERAAAEAVGAARRAAAPDLAAAVTARLRALALPHASIAVAVDDADVAGEHVQFQLAANPGSPLLPLTRVASGGELARSMLALRLVLTADDDTPRTLAFDEVDAGIGGTAATAVGHALAEVGHRHQVLVVTHLAQVAAQATTQVAVVKSVAGDVTTARAAVVDGDDRVAELARMLSGKDGGDAARRHAVELLAGAASAAVTGRRRRQNT
jgi:DNA repair protein RecN (Recombination protein N)